MLAKNHSEHTLEAGCDEAGRGCLAGPVFAAAVILPPKFRHKKLNDSKQMTEKDRYLLRDVIEKNAVAFAVQQVDNTEIDKINILNASFLAMHRALDNLAVMPEFIIVDGNRFHSYREIRHACIVEGDAKYLSIAAASVLAKTYRDDYMKQLAEHFPVYKWHKNKGYATQEHRTAIRESGVSPYHRMSFQLLESQLELEF